MSRPIVHLARKRFGAIWAACAAHPKQCYFWEMRYKDCKKKTERWCKRCFKIWKAEKRKGVA